MSQTAIPEQIDVNCGGVMMSPVQAASAQAVCLSAAQNPTTTVEGETEKESPPLAQQPLDSSAQSAPAHAAIPAATETSPTTEHVEVVKKEEEETESPQLAQPPMDFSAQAASAQAAIPAATATEHVEVAKTGEVEKESPPHAQPLIDSSAQAASAHTANSATTVEKRGGENRESASCPTTAGLIRSSGTRTCGSE